MAWKRWRTCSTLILLLLIVGSRTQQQEFPLSASPSDMKVDGDGRVFLAAGNQLLRLDSTLALQENMTLGSSVLKVALSSDERRVVVCLGDMSCSVYNASNFGAGEQSRRMGATASSDVVALFTAEENNFFVGSILSGAMNSMYLRQYGFGDRDFIRSTDYTIQRTSFIRTFFGGFVNGTNAYYFMADGNPRDVRGLRVLRACDFSTCSMGSSPCTFEALYEIRIDCGGGNFPQNAVICGLSVLDSFAGSSDTTVVLARCNTGTSARNRVCSYRLADIDDKMNRKYTECAGGTGDLQVAWDSGLDRRCAGSFVAQGVCNFNLPLGDVEAVDPDPGSPVAGSVQLEFGDTEITASTAITVDSTSIIYAGYTNTSGNFVGAFHITTTLSLLVPEDSFYTRVISSPVMQLQWKSELNFIYVATESFVLQIPLEECANFTDCESCISYNNPLCGWCTVEHKCSRRSQCQNAVEPVRWVQNSSQCISTTITPNQFVLDDPEILSVTVTRGLPPLLMNESYQCQFAEREGLRVITVDAEEVTPNTAYQCNITGRIPTFTGIQLVMDLSFVSSDVDVPFATNVGALTVTRCESAASCSQCLQTDNACGWCIYNKVCSGTPAPCTNGTNWFQLNGANTTYLDVCPLLEPSPSTTTGDYVQPVDVDRDIELQTRNLPAPISGFSYICSLRGSVNLPAVYNNESSLTCRVNENEILLSSSTGRENITISIVWVIASSGRQHPIDPSTPVNMVLYNCSSLAEGCSPCLGANLGTSFDCGWCDGSSDDMCRVSEDCRSPAQFATAPNECPAATITSVLPASGPPQGGTTVNITGTDLGVTFADVANNVMISSSPCITQENGYIQGTQIVCKTTAFTSGPGSKNLVITVQRGTGSDVVVRGTFTVVVPTVTGVEPSFGPMSGGTSVIIRGTGLNISNVEDTRVTLDGEDGPECIIQMLDISATEIRCDSTAYPYNSSLLPSTGSVVVHIGNANVTGAGVEFTFRRDPTFTDVDPSQTIPAGGITLNFTGTELDSVQRPTLVVNNYRATPPRTVCHPESDTLLVCTAPALSGGGPLDSNINYTIIMDNAPGPSNSGDLRLSLVPDPSIVTTDYTVGAGTPITIEGMNLDSVHESEIRVLVGGEPCDIINVGDTAIVCTPPSQEPGDVTAATVMVFIGTNLNFTVGTLTYTSTGGLGLQLIIPVIVGPVALVLLLSMLVICVIICVTRSSARAKDKRLTTLLSQMELWELEMADECKRAFTELQTDLADLVHVSADKNLPYRDFRTFAMRFLFPSAGEDHPVLLPLDVSEKRDHEATVQHLEGFKKLVLDKKFLTVFVRTLEAQQGLFNLQDKCNVASLLMVSFQNDLDYATDILQTLLAELMRKTVAKSHPKLLLRRTESVAEKMLANWLSFLLFPHVLEHVGEPLFILYRAVKSQLEKGPVDILTGEARHSLSEEKLLRQHLDVKSVEGVIETESGEEISIKLLDTDSVTQAKEKVLDALYRNTPVSKRPQLTEIDLELRRANAGVVLRDQDQTNIKEGEWTRVNTLGHYKLDEMSQAHIDNPKAPIPRFRIVPRPQRPVSDMSFDTLGTIIANVNVSRSSLLSSEAPRVYHLVKPELGEAEDGGPRQGAKIMSEVFLTRLLSTKRILQPYVDDLFHAIFAIPRGRPLPKAIKCLFDFLDLQAAELGIQDHEILHTWKTNSLPLRFWVNLIKNPDFVFDINKSATVDACLTIIAQAYIDACSTAELRYTKDTPSARLLYVNEVKNYKNEVRQYYDSIQSLPKLAPSEMQEYLRETAQTRQLYFVTESALYELFKYASRYWEEISEALNEEGLSVLASTFVELQKSLKV